MRRRQGRAHRGDAPRLVCANAGVDQSNVDADTACLLPEDSDRSARALRDRLRRSPATSSAVIIADTFGRPWREGLVNVAVGLAGLRAAQSYLGELDPAGHVLQATILALADELAGAAEPVMGKLDRIPVAIIRGLDWARGRRLEPRAAPRSGPRPVPLTPTTVERARRQHARSASWAEPARKARGSACAGRRPGTR